MVASFMLLTGLTVYDFAGFYCKISEEFTLFVSLIQIRLLRKHIIQNLYILWHHFLWLQELAALIIPGGFAPDYWRRDKRFLDLVKNMYDSGRWLKYLSLVLKTKDKKTHTSIRFSHTIIFWGFFLGGGVVLVDYPVFNLYMFHCLAAFEWRRIHCY